VVGSLRAGVALATGDVDRDGRLDVYLQQTCVKDGDHTTDLPDVLLHNEGNGFRFSTVAIPDAPESCGQAVTPIDYNRDGRTDFIVLNGRDRFPGSVQLIDFSPEH
jgi:hypothetical protein